ncbi:MAG: ion channel [Bryobacteraceae bacterium]
MSQPRFDPGLTQQFTGVLRRSINKDGSFNVRRRGGSWRDFHPYLIALNMTWPHFFLVVLAAYTAVNLVFAFGYFLLGSGALAGADAPTAMGRFWNDFFFSAHTLTTVGYGNISPASMGANIITAIEALTGLLGAALGTGVLFGRFSRPSARLAFSEKMLVSNVSGTPALQFRIANQRSNVMMDLRATVILMTVEGKEENRTRKFQQLNLEREGIYFLPLTWTIVHPIEESSPLYGKSPEELEKLQAEFLIVVRGFDDTFSQTVHARYSYRHDEMVWSARFHPAFEIDTEGNIVLNVDRVSAHALAAGN